jgi:teichuronic acid biosynthesis glycosyltransferase TuaC
VPLIGVVTPLFPQPDQIYRGQAIYESVRALCNYADVELFYLHTVYGRAELRAAGSGERRIQDGIPVTDVPYAGVRLISRPLNGRNSARSLYPHLAKLHCDAVLGYWMYPEGYGAVTVAQTLGKPAVLCARGSDLRRVHDPLTRRLLSEGIRRADYVTTVSDDLRRRALRLGASPARSRTIHNGCDHTVFRYAERSAAREALGIAGDGEIVLYVGRLVFGKGLVELLKAFHGISANRPRARLVLVGDGPLEPALRRTAERRGLAGRVAFPGPAAAGQVAQWMQAADVLCLPSHSEGCPNVVLEAMSCGCPVVASDVGGVPEILSPQGGTLTPPADAARLAAALSETLGRVWPRETMSRSFGRTWDTVARETFEVCREVIQPVRPVKRKPSAPRTRITVVTPYFPTSADSYRGHSAFHTIQHLTAHADVSVICPIASYPRVFGWGPKSHDAPDRNYQPPGIPTTYLQYPAVPILTRPINGVICEDYVRPYLAAHPPDVLLNYWLYPEGYAMLRAGQKLGIPAIVGSIGSDLRRIPDLATRHLVQRTLRGAAGVITVSEDLRRIAISMGAAPSKVTTILNGCDTSLFFPLPRDEARREVGVSNDEQIVLFVGSLLPTKGLSELVEAFAGLAGANSKARLVMIGEGRFREQVVRKAGEAAVQGRVMMLGRQPSETVAKWMRAADLFCLPSYSEGCPNVIVEALCCGRPIVATNVGGIPELVDGRSGILVPPRDPAALRSALEAGLRAQWDSRRIGAIVQRGWAAVAEETFAVCQTVLENARRAAAGEGRQ